MIPDLDADRSLLYTYIQDLNQLKLIEVSSVSGERGTWSKTVLAKLGLSLNLVEPF